MKKTKVFNLLALVFNVIIIGAFIYAFIILQGDKIQALQYFTVLSNGLLALVALICIPFNIYGLVNGKKLNRTIFSLKFMATVAVMTTMIVTITFLLPKNNWDVNYLLGFANPIKSAEFFMHLAIPVVGLLTFIIFDKRNSNKHLFILPLLGVLPVVAYGVFYILNNILQFIKPTDWYGFFDGALWLGILIVALLIIGSYFVGLLILSLNRIGNKDEVSEPAKEEYRPVEVIRTIPRDEPVKEEETEEQEEDLSAEEELKDQLYPEEEVEEEKEEIPEEEEKVEEEEVVAEDNPQEEEKVKEEVKEEKKVPAKPKEKKPASTTKSATKKPATKKESSKEGNTKVYHLTKRKEDGMWAITFVGGKKAIKLFKTKKEAEAALEVLTKNQGATALIRNSKGAKAGKFASSIKAEEK